jgi:glycosyltransferase involved in cell wall biosynthesis
MKILSVSNCALSESQGSGYVIINFCRKLRERGHKVDLFGPDSYEPLGFIKRAKTYRQSFGILGLTIRQIILNKYDVVEFYGGQSWLATLVLHVIPNRPFIIVSHSNGLETHYNETLNQSFQAGYLHNPSPHWFQINQTALFRRAFTNADAIVTVSQNDRSYAISQAYQVESNILAIENSLPDSYLNNNVDFNRNPVIGYCGSWIIRKGIKVISQDVSRFLIDFPDSRFKLVGVGKDFDKQKHFPGEICSQIDVVSFVENKEDLKAIYQSISILIMPSLYESFGLVIAEAMACGCAVISSKVGFAASLKNNEEAVVLEKPISPLLYKAIRKLWLDDALRLKIAKQGYHRVQALEWDLAAGQLEKAYQSWLEDFRRNK